MDDALENKDFVEDVLSMVAKAPRLVSDLVKSMRGGWGAEYKPASGRRWKNVRAEDVERVLREYGAHLACRTHGAGLAVYVAEERFAEVPVRGGRVEPVRAY